MAQRPFDILTQYEHNALKEPLPLAKTTQVRAHTRRIFRKPPPQRKRNLLVKQFVEPFMASIEQSGGPTARDVRHAQEIVQLFDDWGLLPDFEIKRRD